MRKQLHVFGTIALVGCLLVSAGGPSSAGGKKKAGCAAFAPPESVAGHDVVKLTDVATADEPVELKVATQAGLPEVAVSHAYVPLQVDSVNATAILSAKITFQPQWSYSLEMLDSKGRNVSRTGAQPGSGSAQIAPILTKDCAGFVVDVVGNVTPGDTVTLQLWLAPAS